MAAKTRRLSNGSPVKKYHQGVLFIYKEHCFLRILVHTMVQLSGTIQNPDWFLESFPLFEYVVRFSDA